MYRYFMKIIDIVATRCPYFKAKCTKFDSGWGSGRSAPGPAGGGVVTALPSSPDSKLDSMGPISKGKEGEVDIGEEKGVEEKEGNGKENKGEGVRGLTSKGRAGNKRKMGNEGREIRLCHIHCHK